MNFRCRCVWEEMRCPNNATQEDGLCDWCGNRRDEDVRSNPKAMIDPETGTVLGFGGGGEIHSDTRFTPDACWMPNSGRTLAGEG